MRNNKIPILKFFENIIKEAVHLWKIADWEPDKDEYEEKIIRRNRMAKDFEKLLRDNMFKGKIRRMFNEFGEHMYLSTSLTREERMIYASDGIDDVPDAAHPINEKEFSKIQNQVDRKIEVVDSEKTIIPNRWAHKILRKRVDIGMLFISSLVIQEKWSRERAVKAIRKAQQNFKAWKDASPVEIESSAKKNLPV